jgi:hypothetical protein
MTISFHALRGISKYRGVAALASAALLALLAAGTASASHPRPGSGTPYRVPLVNAYEQCSKFTAYTHGPEGTPSCPAFALSQLTNGNTGTSSGFVRLAVFCDNGASPPCTAASGDQEDISIEAFVNDVRCRFAGFLCNGGTNESDYFGEVMLRFPIRLTDHYNEEGLPAEPCASPAGDPPCQSATVIDWDSFGIPFACTTVGSDTAPPGSTCSLTTTIDSLAAPTAVTERQRGIYRLPGEIQVADPGEDQVFDAPPSLTAGVGGGFGCPTFCGTGDENVFMAQGLFAP